MSNFLRGLCLSALFTTTFGVSAHAQGVMAQEIWMSWQESVKRSGGALTAVETREGMQLVLTDVTLDLGEDAGQFQLKELRLINQADGSVGVVFPQTFPVLIDLPGEGVAERGAYRPDKMIVEVTAADLKLSVQGLGERAEFVANAPQIDFTLERMIPPLPEGVSLPQASLHFEAADLRYMQDLATAVPMLDAGLAFSAFQARFGQDESWGQAAQIALALQKSVIEITGALPKERGGAGFLALLEGGLRAGLKLDLGAAHTTGALLSENAPAQSFSYAIEQTKLLANLDRAGLSLEGAASRSQMSSQAVLPELPAGNFAANLDELAIAAKFGLNGLKSVQDWSMSFTLSGLNIAEPVWAALDPSGEIARDPIGLGFDLDGRYGLRPEALAGEMPASSELSPLSELSLRLRNLYASALGVHFEGIGALVFDTNKPVDAQGWPVPNGSLDFVASGLNGVLDHLGRLGLASAQDIQAARALMLMLGRQVEGQDRIETTLEFREGGGFLNGFQFH